LAFNGKAAAWHRTGLSSFIFYFIGILATSNRSDSWGIGSWYPLLAALWYTCWSSGYLLLLLASGNALAAF